MGIAKGEIIALSNNKEYICLNKIANEANQNEEYLYLLGNFKPAEIKFGIWHGEDSTVEIVNNPEQKEKILTLFQASLRQ